METKAFNSNKSNLEKKIADAEEEATKTEAEWLELHTTSFATMKEKLANAKATLKITNVTSAELASAYKALNEAMV